MNLSLNKGMPDTLFRLIWFSEIQWDFLSTRKQRILGRFPENWRILFIEPYALGRRHHWFPVKRGRVWVVSVPFLKSVPYRIGRLLDISLFRLLVSLPGIVLMLFWVTLLGFASSERIIGLSNIYWGRVAALLPCRLRFYDANDDHLAFPGSPVWLKGYLDTCLSSVQLLFSVSPELTARLQVPAGLRCIELGNGVEFSHFATPTHQAPSGLFKLKGPILGYAGAMDWLDTALVAATAKAWPDYSILLIGPAYELYEYCASGIPVLSMNYCSAVDRAREVVHIASSHEAFIRMIPEALADNRREARQVFARQHSWDTLAAAMVQELQNAYQEQSP